jgi:hypothetical protein
MRNTMWRGRGMVVRGEWNRGKKERKRRDGEEGAKNAKWAN